MACGCDTTRPSAARTRPISASSPMPSSGPKRRLASAHAPWARCMVSRAVTFAPWFITRAARTTLSRVRARRRRPEFGSRKYMSARPTAAPPRKSGFMPFRLSLRRPVHSTCGRSRSASREKVGERLDIGVAHAIQRGSHDGVAARALVVAVGAHLRLEVRLALAGEARDLVLAAEVGEVANPATQRLCPLDTEFHQLGIGRPALHPLGGKL